MTESGILSLERAHRFCIKYMQGLNIRTRTYIALSIMTLYTNEPDSDFRKLTGLNTYTVIFTFILSGSYRK